MSLLACLLARTCLLPCSLLPRSLLAAEYRYRYGPWYRYWGRGRGTWVPDTWVGPRGQSGSPSLGREAGVQVGQAGRPGRVEVQVQSPSDEQGAAETGWSRIQDVRASAVCPFLCSAARVPFPVSSSALPPSPASASEGCCGPPCAQSGSSARTSSAPCVAVFLCACAPPRRVSHCIMYRRTGVAVCGKCFALSFLHRDMPAP